MYGTIFRWKDKKNSFKKMSVSASYCTGNYGWNEWEKKFFFSILQLMDRMKSSAKQNENKTTLN